MKAGLYHKLKRTVRFQHTVMERFAAITDLSKMIFSRKDSLGWHFPRRSRRNEKEHTGKSRVTCSCVTVTNCATHIWAESTPLEICLRLLIRGRLSQWRKLYPRLRTWHICHLFLFLSRREDNLSTLSLENPLAGKVLNFVYRTFGSAR